MNDIEELNRQVGEVIEGGFGYLEREKLAFELLGMAAKCLSRIQGEVDELRAHVFGEDKPKP